MRKDFSRIAVVSGLVSLHAVAMTFAEDGRTRKALPSPAEIAQLPTDGGEEFNRLIFEKSPYLLQHARNPIDWRPWGEAAFAEAKRLDKPVFLSIGYATCHWCHVMEHESFEDDEVAALINERFIAIKVDREERPDIDEVYMQVTQAMTDADGRPIDPGKSGTLDGGARVGRRRHDASAGVCCGRRSDGPAGRSAVDRGARRSFGS